MNEVIERVKVQFSTIYLTLVSVIQASVLSYLMVRADGLLDALSVRSGLQLVTTFLVVVSSWNEYVMGSSTFRWIPNLLDSFLPFLLGASEFLMVRSLARAGASWYFWLAVFCLVGFVAFLHQYRTARHLPDNDPVLAALGRWPRASEALLVATAAFAVLAGVIDNALPRDSAGRNLVAAAAVVATLAYYIRTVLYWRRITQYVPARTDRPGGR